MGRLSLLLGLCVCALAWPVAGEEQADHPERQGHTNSGTSWIGSLSLATGQEELLSGSCRGVSPCQNRGKKQLAE